MVEGRPLSSPTKSLAGSAATTGKDRPDATVMGREEKPWSWSRGNVHRVSISGMGREGENVMGFTIPTDAWSRAVVQWSFRGSHETVVTQDRKRFTKLAMLTSWKPNSFFASLSPLFQPRNPLSRSLLWDSESLIVWGRPCSHVLEFLAPPHMSVSVLPGVYHIWCTP